MTADQIAMFDFDQVVDRSGTCSLKYDSHAAHGRPADVLPLWVADMDFKVPPCIDEALRAVLDHGVLGYGGPRPGYGDAVCSWFAGRHGWHPDPESLVTTPGVMFAVCAAIRALTQARDAVLVHTPAYYPFVEAVRDNGRRLVQSPLAFDGRRYGIDIDALERTIVDEGVRAVILCSPHNPTGRVWTCEELAAVGAVCEGHGVRVICDEIHGDFAFDGHAFVPFALACPQAASRGVICTSPSKSFNIGGLQVSNIFVADEALRAAFTAQVRLAGVHEPNALGLAACQAAYEGGAAWLDACKVYLRGNTEYLRQNLERRVPNVRMIEPDGTYYAWLDFSGLGLSKGALNRMLIDEARLWLSPGHTFGAAYKQFQRMVLACPRATVEEAVHRLECAVSTLA